MWKSFVIGLKKFVLPQITSNHFGFESQQGRWILSCEEAIFQLAYRTLMHGSTQVPLCAFYNAWKGLQNIGGSTQVPLCAFYNAWKGP
jgi:hypothetical protein